MIKTLLSNLKEMQFFYIFMQEEILLHILHLQHDQRLSEGDPGQSSAWPGLGQQYRPEPGGLWWGEEQDVRATRGHEVSEWAGIPTYGVQRNWCGSRHLQVRYGFKGDNSLSFIAYRGTSEIWNILTSGIQRNQCWPLHKWNMISNSLRL